MACLLTSGRALQCKNSVGGLKAVYFADYGTLGDVTIVAGEITAIAGTPDFYKYDIKGSSSLETPKNVKGAFISSIRLIIKSSIR